MPNGTSDRRANIVRSSGNAAARRRQYEESNSCRNLYRVFPKEVVMVSLFVNGLRAPRSPLCSVRTVRLRHFCPCALFPAVLLRYSSAVPARGVCWVQFLA
jgi:hypothetical protein